MSNGKGSKPTGSEGAGISGLTEEAQKVASTVAAGAQDAARRVVEQQASTAADRVDEAARVLDNAAEAVDRVLPEAAGYVRGAAETIHDFSSTVRQQNVDDLVQAVLKFARTQPTVFFGGSILAGFALARFVKASSDERMQAQSSGVSGGRPGARRPAPQNRVRPGGEEHGSASHGGPQTTKTDDASVAANQERSR